MRKQAGVGLAVEYLNRFEIYLLNTAADTARFIRDVNHPRCRMMYDTFHANIEEKSPAEAIRTAAPLMALVHISENDRSTPGTGNIPWSATFDAPARSDLQRLAGGRSIWAWRCRPWLPRRKSGAACIKAKSNWPATRWPSCAAK